MGRKSTATKLLEDNKDEETPDGGYLVLYDFIEKQPHHRFWSNLREIISMAGGERIQFGAYMGSHRGAKAVRELALMYGADVRSFEAFELR